MVMKETEYHALISMSVFSITIIVTITQGVPTPKARSVALAIEDLPETGLTVQVSSCELEKLGTHEHAKSRYRYLK